MTRRRPPTDQPLVTRSYRPREVADMLGISERAVRDAVYRGELKALRLGEGRKMICIPVESLNDFIRANQP